MIKKFISIFFPQTANQCGLFYKKLRAKYYKLFYSIGNGCSFEKIYFHKRPRKDSIKDLLKIGNNVTIFRRTEIQIFENNPIIIGNNVFINQECIINPLVTIGNNISIAPRVSFMTVTHLVGDSFNRAGKQIFKPIVVKDGCWIGSNVTILGGVTIGSGTVIGAGSVVTKDCEPNCLYTGVPAKKIKYLEK